MASAAVELPVIPPLIDDAATVFAPRVKIVCLGDSITQKGSEPDGWVGLLSHWYSRRGDVFNRGFSGYNSNHALAMLQQHIAAGVWPTIHADTPASATPAVAVPTLVTIFFGANDSCLPNAESKAQAVSVAQYRSNIASMLRALIGEKGALAKQLGLHVVVIGPPHVDAKTWGLVSQRKWNLEYAPITRDNAHTVLYSQAAAEVAAEFSLPFIDLFAATPESQWRNLLIDGLHLTAQGNRLLFDQLLKVIDTSYPALSAAKLPVDSFPFGKIPGGTLEETAAFFEKSAQKPAAVSALTPASTAPAPAVAAAGNEIDADAWRAAWDKHECK